MRTSLSKTNRTGAESGELLLPLPCQEGERWRPESFLAFPSSTRPPALRHPARQQQQHVLPFGGVHNIASGQEGEGGKGCAWVGPAATRHAVVIAIPYSIASSGHHTLQLHQQQPSATTAAPTSRTPTTLFYYSKQSSTERVYCTVYFYTGRRRNHAVYTILYLDTDDDCEKGPFLKKSFCSGI